MTLALLCVSLIAAAPMGDPIPPNDITQTYQEAKAKAGRSPEEQVRLALWCEAHGLSAQRLNHLTLAVLADPKNLTARGLMGLILHEGRWQRPEVIADKAKADPVLLEYGSKRVKAAYAADAQYALGVWCEEHGLKEQAKAHLTAVIRLDPKRENAWKKLGYKKHEGRWVTDAQLAAEKTDAEAQKLADHKWKLLLEKYKAMLDQPSRREEAEAALAEISDPRAVPSIGLVFARSESTQPRAVQLLGQVDAPAASKALAFLAVFAKSAEARRAASEILRGRDPREFANLLIALIRDPIKYEVRPVGGPGSPGMLFVEGKRVNLQRYYSPPSAPSFSLRPGDILTTDEYGLPVVNRQGGYIQSTTGRITADRLLADMGRGLVDPRVIAELSSNPSFGDVGPFLGHLINDSNARNNGSLAAAIAQVEKQEHKAPSQFGFGITTYSNVGYQIPVGQMMLEAQKTAKFAQQQLESDVAALDAYNKAIAPRNESVRQLLATVAGKDLGLDVNAWKNWWVNQLGYVYKATEESPKSTVVEDVPLSYQPQPVLVQQVVTPAIQTFSRMSCFGAGTPVRTLDGTRAIESLKVGDLVLTQSTSSGALGYKPILVVHHNPPSATFRIQLKGEPIISSHFHRFWVAGRGWVMARDLKAGDPVRTLGGVVPVEAVEADKVQLVYNLDIAEDADFFAGNLGALVHDNTLPDPRLAPFDAPTKSGAAAVARRADD